MKHFHLHQIWMQDQEHLSLEKLATSKDKACQHLQSNSKIMMKIINLYHLADNS
jgi:hypothetical protein